MYLPWHESISELEWRPRADPRKIFDKSLGSEFPIGGKRIGKDFEEWQRQCKNTRNKLQEENPLELEWRGSLKVKSDEEKGSILFMIRLGK